MTRGSQHPMRRHDKPPHRGSTEAAMPSSFRDLFVKPLKDGYLSIGKGEVRPLSLDAFEGLREQVMSAHRPRASLADARSIWRIGTMVLEKVAGLRRDSVAAGLKCAVTKLGKIRAECRRRQTPRQGMAGNRGTGCPQTPPQLAAQMHEAVRDVVINISVTINVENGGHVSLGDALSTGIARASDCVADSIHKEKPEESEVSEIPEKPEKSEIPKKPEMKKVRGKGKNHFIAKRDISGCPYEFLPDRKSLKYIPTGKTYTFSGEKTIKLVNRLTGGMMHDDWHVPLSGDDINHLRSTSTCRDFLNDCVVREKYTGSPNGNRKWSGRVRLRDKNDRK